jgi:3-oxoacyl-[acyl-carrier protein] reductase
MQIDLAGKTAVVTGGGTGIGRAISEGLASSGAKVTVNYSRSRAEAEQTVSGIEERGGQAMAVQADVTDVQQVEQLIAQTASAYGGVDILVNNAGGLLGKCSIDEMSVEFWARVIELNLSSVFYCCKAALPWLSKSGGRIINIGSISGHTGGGKEGLAYGAAKGGMVTLTRGLAGVLAEHEITVNAIAPGIIDTRIHKEFTAPEHYQALIKRIPLGRDGKPSDIAGIVVLLASDQGGYINGEIIHVNGGMLMV